MVRKAISYEKRLEIIHLKKHTTHSNRQIAARVDVSEKCVRTTWANYNKTNSAKEKHKPGRPRKYSERDENYIFRQARVNFKWSNRDLAHDYNSNRKNVSVSRETIRRILLRKGIGSYIAVRKPLLTVKDRIKRLNWCRQRQHWTIEKWSTVLFSDESNFEVFNRKGRVWVKRLKNEKYLPQFITPRLQGGGGSAGIWGCFSYAGTGVSRIYTGRINQHLYINTLEECLLPSVQLLIGHNNPYIFQQDGAPAHTAHSVHDWFGESNVELLPWCARSPDLNPIENIWAWMDQQMSRQKITSIEHLKEVLHVTWLSVPQDLCIKLIQSMPRRIKECIRNKGGHFRY